MGSPSFDRSSSNPRLPPAEGLIARCVTPQPSVGPCDGPTWIPIKHRRHPVSTATEPRRLFGLSQSHPAFLPLRFPSPSPGALQSPGFSTLGLCRFLFSLLPPSSAFLPIAANPRGFRRSASSSSPSSPSSPWPGVRALGIRWVPCLTESPASQPTMALRQGPSILFVGCDPRQPPISSAAYGINLTRCRRLGLRLASFPRDGVRSRRSHHHRDLCVRARCRPSTTGSPPKSGRPRRCGCPPPP